MRQLQVVKIGTESIFAENGVNYEVLFKLGYDLAKLKVERGIYSILVASGAIGLGWRNLGYTSRPQDKRRIRACSAFGQGLLVKHYEEGLDAGYSTYTKEKNIKNENLNVAGIVYPHADWNDLSRRKGVIGALESLLTLNVQPIVNNQDYLDPSGFSNDYLAAEIAIGLNAERLMLLTKEEGLLDIERRLVTRVYEITDEIKGLCWRKGVSTGGMETKLDAAQMTSKNNIPAIIGNAKHGLVELIDNENIRTLVYR